MKRVTGVGGIFFKSDDPEKLYQWYEKHLGVHRGPDGSGATFEWRETDEPDKKGMTVWSIFPRGTKYFEPSNSAFMINYRVTDLDELLEELKKEGSKSIRTAKTMTTDASPGSWIQMAIALSWSRQRKRRRNTPPEVPRGILGGWENCGRLGV